MILLPRNNLYMYIDLNVLDLIYIFLPLTTVAVYRYYVDLVDSRSTCMLGGEAQP